MRLTICLTAALLLCAGSAQALAGPDDDTDAAPKPAAFQLNETTWTFTDDKLGKVEESIDADGNYISQTAGGKHLDHGVAAMKDDKACFTSAMTKEGEICWTTGPVEIGGSMVTTSDTGRKLKVTRVKYAPLSMPK